MPLEAAQTASARKTDDNGYITIESNPISRAGIFQYLGKSISKDAIPDKKYNVYRPAEELCDPEAIESFKLIPLIDDHDMLGVQKPGLLPPETKGVHGTTGDIISFKDNVLYANLKIFSNFLADMLRRGKRDLSLGYFCKFRLAPGFFNGEPYDYVQYQLRGNHLALVKDARCDVAVLDENSFAFDSFDLTLDTQENIMADDKEKEKKEAADRAARDERMDKVCDWAEKSMAKDAAEEEEKKKKEAEDKAAQDAGAASRVKDEDDDKKNDDKKKTEDKSSKDADEKAAGMDEAIKSIKALSEDVSSLKSGTFVKSMLKHTAERDKLAESLSPFIGTFDHSEMTVADVAVYGVEKLKVPAVKGQELVAINAYLHGRTPDKTRYAMDSRNTSGGKLSSFIKQKSA